MTSGEEHGMSLRNQENLARARYIHDSSRADTSQLNLAKAYVNSLLGGIHGAGFARRMAWDLTDPKDKKQIQKAVEELGYMERVVRAIVAQTGPQPVPPREGRNIGMEVHILKAGGDVEEDLVIIQRKVVSLKLKSGSRIRKRAKDDPAEWFAAT